MTPQDVVDFIQNLYQTKAFIPLHEPRFRGKEKDYLINCIDSTFVSSVGQYVDDVEIKIASITGAKYAVVTSNGTSALHLALVATGVKSETEVITQPLTFVATSNAINYCGAHPVFIDVDMDTMGLSPEKLSDFLVKNTHRKNDQTINKRTGRVISAVMPMHTFGHPCRIADIRDICKQYELPLIEDAAEAMGSRYLNKHLGNFGNMGVLSFNGNKIITAGGGGAIICNDATLAKRLKHLSTTAKVPHKWEYVHDQIGYNYRMPNLNAALLLAQLDQLSEMLDSKRHIANKYQEFFSDTPIKFKTEPINSTSNYWLCAIELPSKAERDLLLDISNQNGVMSRPIWKLTHRLPMYKDCFSANLDNAEQLESTIVNLPSSAIL